MNLFVLFKVISQVIQLIGFEKDVFELVSLVFISSQFHALIVLSTG